MDQVNPDPMNNEQHRIAENNSLAQRWPLWGPYLATDSGVTRGRVLTGGTKTAWAEFQITKGQLCFAFALWNRRGIANW